MQEGKDQYRVASCIPAVVLAHQTPPIQTVKEFLLWQVEWLGHVPAGNRRQGWVHQCSALELGGVCPCF
jgi:hypothetical protein